MLTRKLSRTIWRYKAQFFSMILMILLGAGIFLGFNMEWISIERNTGRFFEETGFADYRIIDENGLTAENAATVAALDGVKAAARYLQITADLEDGSGGKTGSSLFLTVTESEAVSFFTVMEGGEYDPLDTEGLWLSDRFAQAGGIAVGDSVTLRYEDYEIAGTVRGLIESGEQLICVRDESQLMPSFDTFGYAYISPEKLKRTLFDASEKRIADAVGAPESAVEELAQKASEEVYRTIFPQINVISTLDKEAFSEKVNEAFGRTMLILTKDDTISYAEAMGESEEGKTMGSVLPVLFLAIAVLTMLTTMNRITVQERTQIGMLKALGFRDRRITRHYTSFAAMIALLGILPGIPLGYGIAYLIMNPNGMMGTYMVMPEWRLYLPFWLVAVLVGIFALIVLAGYLSVKSVLRGTAAETLRPYVPKKIKRLALEKTRLWERLGFGTRWNLRDIMRHKSRSLMSLVGVTGCMLLLVAGLGMRDTADSFIDTYYDKVTVYASKLQVPQSMTDGEARALAEKYDGDYSAAIAAETDGEPVALEIYNVSHGNFNFLSEDSELIPLPSDGALVCMRLKDKYGLKVGDTVTVSPYGTSEEYTIRIAGVNRSLFESLTLSEAYAETLGVTRSEAYRISSIYTMAGKEEILARESLTVQSKQDIVESFDSFMEIMNLMIVILVAAAVVLGLIVLYNLGVMSYMERYREMATLKVLGFKDRSIGKLLILQNLWISLVGVVVGLVAGVAVLKWLLTALASEYEMDLVLGPTTYAVSILLTVGVSLLVSFFIARKNRRIDMVAALKTEE